jgi:phospholipase D-like protein
MDTLAFGFGGPIDVAVLSLLSLIFWIWMLVDIARRQFPDQSTKIIWFVVVFFLSALGALIYVLVGRKQGIIS